MKCHRLWARISCAFAILTVSIVPLHAQITAGTGAAAVSPSTAQTPHITPSPLLAIDQHRDTVVERIDSQWGEALAYSGAGVSRPQLREMLMGLRADQLLAASLAGSLTGLRDVLAQSLTTATAAKPTLLQSKALGDTSDDLVYTPVSPCRLFDTRPAQGGLGVMTPNVRRTYGATTPVANQGGPGGCNAPVGAAVALIQIGSLTPSGNGYLQGGAQGIASFPNALILYQAGDQYGTAVAMPLNVANGQFDVQVQFAATDLYGDLLGYFKAPSGAGNYFVRGGNAFGAPALLGTSDNQPLEIGVNGARVMRFEPNGTSPNVIGGFSGNSVAAGVYAATISGGGDASFPNSVAFGGFGASWATIGGGHGNIASGNQSTVAGGSRNSASNDSATVAGGQQNIASGLDSAVGGGLGNHAIGHSSTIGGGDGNTAGPGIWSTVPGGYLNVAAGDQSQASGVRAKANHNNSFVWGGDPNNDTVSQETGDFTVYAPGKVRLYAGALGAGGCVLPDGITGWQCASDRNLKENFTVLDTRDVLTRLSAIPITSWNAKAVAGIRHIGPMAQDFYAAFGLGDSELYIGTTDAQGVALAAIQGLNAKLDERIAEQQRAITELRERASAAESLRGELAAVKAALAEMQRAREIAAAR